MLNMNAGNDTKGGVKWQSKFGQAWKQSDNRGFYFGELAACPQSVSPDSATSVFYGRLWTALIDDWIGRPEFKQRMEQRARVARFDQP